MVTSDAGLLAYRELDDALGLTVMAGEMLADARTGKTGRHALVGLLLRCYGGRVGIGTSFRLFSRYSSNRRGRFVARSALSEK